MNDNELLELERRFNEDAEFDVDDLLHLATTTLLVLISDLRTARAALVKHGRHTITCDASDCPLFCDCNDSHMECSCGLAERLTEARGD